MKKHNRRKLDGILLLDKPSGLSSNQVLQDTKYLYFAAKAGHTGSLDPLATGMLPICFGEATKFSQFLLDSDKSYVVTAKLGVRTTTSDSEGDVVSERPVPHITIEDVDRACDQFRGLINQIPSMYSALKYEGKPLYYYARQGIEVPRKERQIKIFKLDVLEVSDDEVTLFVHCSKGTYIRTLCDDLGELLGCGAHVIALRRTQVSHFKEEDMVTLDQLKAFKEANAYQEMDDLLLPIDSALEGWPALQLNDDLIHYIKQGSPVLVPNLPREYQQFRLKTKDDQFIGIGELQDDGRIAPRRLIAS